MEDRPSHRYEALKAMTRRHCFKQSSYGMGLLALSALLSESLFADPAQAAEPHSVDPLAPRPSHFPAKAKNIIFLFMAGVPSQLDLLDYKPKLNQYNGQIIPEEFVKGERFAFIKGVPKLLGTSHKFAPCGKS